MMFAAAAQAQLQVTVPSTLVLEGTFISTVDNKSLTVKIVGVAANAIGFPHYVYHVKYTPIFAESNRGAVKVTRLTQGVDYPTEIDGSVQVEMIIEGREYRVSIASHSYELYQMLREASHAYFVSPEGQYEEYFKTDLNPAVAFRRENLGESVLLSIKGLNE